MLIGSPQMRSSKMAVTFKGSPQSQQGYVEMEKNRCLSVEQYYYISNSDANVNANVRIKIEKFSIIKPVGTDKHFGYFCIY